MAFQGGGGVGSGQRQRAIETRPGPLALALPKVIRTWPNPAKPTTAIEGMWMLAWSWLEDCSGGRLPADFTFRLADLAEYFGRASHRSADQWLDGLEAAGLVEVIDRRAGVGGGVHVRLLDPYEVAELYAVRPNPQTEMPFLHAPDVLTIGEAAARTGNEGGHGEIEKRCDSARDRNVYDTLDKPGENARLGKGCDSAQDRNVSNDHDAAGDAPPALARALASELGADRVEFWLGLSRWELAPLPAPSKLFLPERFRHLAPPTEVLRGIHAALAACGFGPLSTGFDGNLGKRCDSAQDRNVSTAQQPSVVRSSTGASNQPTNQPSDFGIGRESQQHPLLEAAAELYGRIGDASLWPWVAIATVLLLDEGTLQQTDVERLIAESRFDFGAAVKSLAGRRWPRQGTLKSRLAAQGIKWRRRWERPTDGRTRRNP